MYEEQAPSTRKRHKNNEKSVNKRSYKKHKQKPRTAFELCSRQVQVLQKESQKLSNKRKKKLFALLEPLMKVLNPEATLRPPPITIPVYQPVPPSPYNQHPYSNYPPPPPAPQHHHHYPPPQPSYAPPPSYHTPQQPYYPSSRAPSEYHAHPPPSAYSPHHAAHSPSAQYPAPPPVSRQQQYTQESPPSLIENSLQTSLRKILATQENNIDPQNLQNLLSQINNISKSTNEEASAIVSKAPEITNKKLSSKSSRSINKKTKRPIKKSTPVSNDILVRRPKTPSPTGEYLQFDDSPPTPRSELAPLVNHYAENDANSSILKLEQKIRNILLPLDMPVTDMYKHLCGDGNTALTIETMTGYMETHNVDMDEDECALLIEKYDTNNSQSILLIEFQKLAAAVLGQNYIEKLNCKHLSTIETNGYSNQQCRFMKFLHETFEKEKLPFSKLWLKLLRHSPDEKLDVKSFSSALLKEYGFNIQLQDLIELCGKFESVFEGLTRASFTKMMSVARAL